MSRKHFSAAVLVSMGCSVALSDPPFALIALRKPALALIPRLRDSGKQPQEAAPIFCSRRSGCFQQIEANNR
jgi:hypothetical protein